MSGIGHIGELFVIDIFEKELGLEVYLPLKDKGIDFVGIKNNKVFQIQVKTSMFQKNKYFWFDVKKDRIIKDSYFVFVCYTLNRQKINNRSKNFFIISSKQIDTWIRKKLIPCKKNTTNVYNIFLYHPTSKTNKWLFRNKKKEIDWTKFHNNIHILK